jgi:mannose-6-phosphate isomerase-like protein (cupin superfamily)
VSGSADEGGDPACWAHLFDDDDGATSVDLAPLLEAAGDGVHWTLDAGDDLNANLVRLDPGHEMGEHVNGEVDVLVVVLAGGGRAVVDTSTVELRPHVVCLVAKGARRSIHAGPAGLAYLTVHHRRGGLTIGRA